MIKLIQLIMLLVSVSSYADCSESKLIGSWTDTIEGGTMTFFSNCEVINTRCSKTAYSFNSRSFAIDLIGSGERVEGCSYGPKHCIVDVVGDMAQLSCQDRVVYLKRR